MTSIPPSPQRWLKPYIPIPVLRAADVLADHVDFWEEEAFRVQGRWRARELTEFIRSGMTADRAQCDQFKQLLAEYIDMSQRSPPKEKARAKALGVAVTEVKKWIRAVETT